jgi:hypothetical protein
LKKTSEAETTDEVHVEPPDAPDPDPTAAVPVATPQDPVPIQQTVAKNVNLETPEVPLKPNTKNENAIETLNPQNLQETQTRKDDPQNPPETVKRDLDTIVTVPVLQKNLHKIILLLQKTKVNKTNE